MFKKTINGLILAFLILFVCALLAGCAGPSTGMQKISVPVQQVVGNPAFNLPPPSELKLPKQLSSDLLTQGIDYEQELPHDKIEVSGDHLWFWPKWSQYQSNAHELAYAMYWVRVPDYEHAHVIQWIPSSSGNVYYNGLGKHTLAANFERDCWDWISNKTHLPIREYSQEHILDGHLLVAVIVTNYTSLYGLLAGDIRPPYIEEVSPKLVMAGDKVRFKATLATSSGMRVDPDTVFWDLGAGVWPNQSSNLEPIATVGMPGDYSGTLTCANLAGECAIEFNYTVIGECFPKPQYLYAFPADTELHAGDETLVTIITGPFPDERPCSGLHIGLLLDESLEYVSGSFNLGAPGGDRLALDGFWEQMAEEFFGFIADPEMWTFAADPEIPNRIRYDVPFAPVGANSFTGGGEVWNFRLRFPEPGIYSLGFQEFLDVRLTFYRGDKGDGTWYDISNSAAPQITVLP